MEPKTRQRGLARRGRRLRAGRRIAAGLLLAGVLFPEALSRLVTINLTPGLPRGLYRVTRLRERPGALVTFCLPPEAVRRHGLGRWIAPRRCP